MKKKEVTAALRRYVLAAILTAAACQLASTFDAIAVAQFIDIEAVSVLSLVMPVLVGVNCLGLLPAAFWWSFPLASLLFLVVQLSLQPKLVNG